MLTKNLSSSSLIVLAIFAVALIPATGSLAQEKVLYSFGGKVNDGTTPLGGVIFDGSGNLYGTTSVGGAKDSGTVFELSRGAKGEWRERVLFGFHQSAPGIEPWDGLTLDSLGNLYGTTRWGGTFGRGVAFELEPSDEGWSEKVLHDFSGAGQPTPRTSNAASSSIAAAIFTGRAGTEVLTAAVSCSSRRPKQEEGGQNRSSIPPPSFSMTL